MLGEAQLQQVHCVDDVLLVPVRNIFSTAFRLPAELSLKGTTVEVLARILFVTVSRD